MLSEWRGPSRLCAKPRPGSQPRCSSPPPAHGWSFYSGHQTWAATVPSPWHSSSPRAQRTSQDQAQGVWVGQCCGGEGESGGQRGGVWLQTRGCVWGYQHSGAPPGWGMNVRERPHTRNIPGVGGGSPSLSHTPNPILVRGMGSSPSCAHRPARLLFRAIPGKIWCPSSPLLAGLSQLGN